MKLSDGEMRDLGIHAREQVHALLVRMWSLTSDKEQRATLAATFFGSSLGALVAAKKFAGADISDPYLFAHQAIEQLRAGDYLRSVEDALKQRKF